MTQMIRESASPAVHIELGERHGHLADQSIGGRHLAGKIRLPLTGLKSAVMEYGDAVLNKRFALDSCYLQRDLLANAVRSFTNSVKEIDRDSGLLPVEGRLFMGRTMTEIVEQSYRELPIAVAEIITVTEQLPEGHPVLEKLPALVERKAALETATDDYDNKIEVAKKKRALMHDAMLAVRKQYADNYFEARMIMTRKGAERLFPKIQRSRSEEAQEEVDEDLIDASDDAPCDQGDSDGELASAA